MRRYLQALAWLGFFALFTAVFSAPVLSEPIPAPPTASGGGSAEWTDTGPTLYPSENGDEIVIGSTTPVGAAKFSIAGDTASQIQAIIQGAASQTGDLLRAQDSAGANITSINASGDLRVDGSVTMEDTASCPDPASGDTSICVNAGKIQVRDTGGSTLVIPTNAELFGRTTRVIPAADMQPDPTTGPSAVTLVQPTAGSGVYIARDFDPTTAERAYFQTFMPKSWDALPIRFVPVWTANSTSTNGAAWGLKCRSMTDNTLIPSAYGTQVVVTDQHAGVAHQLNQPPESADVTVANATDNATMSCEIQRNVADAADTLAVDARLLQVALFFGRDALNDASSGQSITTLNATYSDAVNEDGTKAGSGNTDYVGTTTVHTYRSAIQFNPSSIPTTASISKIELILFVISYTPPASGDDSLYIGGYQGTGLGTPSSDAGSTMFSRCEISGDSYGTAPGATSGVFNQARVNNQTVTIDVTTAGSIADLEAAIDAASTYSFALRLQTETGVSHGFDIDEVGGGHPPQVRVTYQ